MAPLTRLGTGTPWVDPRHQASWRRAWREVASATPPRSYPDPSGLPELRAELAAYTARTRGLRCGAEEVLVTQGTTDGWRQLLGVLPPGPVAVEDPGYPAAVAVARELGREVLDLPVDGDGASAEALSRMPADLRAAYLTPAHQHPTGVTMSAPRRLALLAEATRRELLLVEDDYDSEFRYDVAPLPALASLDADRVVHLRTASKAVSPGLRLGWLVARRSVVEEIAARRAVTHDLTGWPVQRAWLSLLREGYVDKMVRASRRVYRARCALVREALAPYGRIDGPEAGMYVTLHLPPEAVQPVRAAMARAGFDLPSLAESSRGSNLSGVVLGFGGVTDDELDHALRTLTAALGRHL